VTSRAEGDDAEGREEAVTRFSPDERVRSIQPLVDALFRNVLYDEQSMYVSDEATMLDVSISDPAELGRRCSEHYQVPVTLDDLRKPLSQLLPELEVRRRDLGFAKT
jgi:hypothetical protein